MVWLHQIHLLPSHLWVKLVAQEAQLPMAASSVPKRAANLGWALVFLAPLLMLDDFVPVTGFFDKSL